METFEEGANLLATLEQTSTPPVLIICDADMPTMEGLEVLTRVSQLQPEIKRLLYTAQEPNRSIVEAFNQGIVHRFIDKSEGQEKLKSCVEELLADYVQNESDLEAIDELLDQQLVELFLQPFLL